MQALVNQVTTALLAGDDVAGAIARLGHDGTLAERAIDLVGCAAFRRSLAQRLGLPTVTAGEREAIERGDDWYRSDPGHVSIAMRRRGRPIGVLHVRAASLDERDRALLCELAHRLADVLDAASARIARDQAAQEAAVAAERERIAADLHDGPGQMFVALGLIAQRHAEQLPPESPSTDLLARLADLAEEGKWQVEQSLRAIELFPAGRRGLIPALRALAETFRRDSAVEVLVDVVGSASGVPPDVEQALFRVAHEALANAWRHARCRTVRIEVHLSADVAELRVMDDGIGLAPRHGQRGVHVGIAGMRAAMARVGGTLNVANGRPCGVVVIARAAAGTR